MTIKPIAMKAPASNPETGLSNIIEEVAKTERLLAQLEAREELEIARSRKGRRKRETRCKIILGGAVLAAWRDLTGDPAQLENRALLLRLLRPEIYEERDKLTITEFFPELFLDDVGSG